MSNLRAVAEFQIGEPDADGRIDKFGWGTTWQFNLPGAHGQPVWVHGISADGYADWAVGQNYEVGDIVAHERPLLGNNPKVGVRCSTAHTSSDDNEPFVGENWRTYWDTGEVEILPELKCACPAGFPCPTDIGEAGITIYCGNWRTAKPYCPHNYTYWHLYRVAPGMTGLIRTTWSAYNFWVRLIRFAPAPNEHLPNEVSIGLIAVNADDLIHEWGLKLPGPNNTIQRPQLWRYSTILPPTPSLWSELEVDSRPASESGGVWEQVLTIEQLGPYLRIAATGAQQWTQYILRPDVTTDDYQFRYYLSVYAQGHPIMAAIQPIWYSRYAEMRPSTYYSLPAEYSNTVHIRTATDTPSGTSVLAATEVSSLNPRAIRPVVRFYSTEPLSRAVVWRVDSYATAEFTDGRGEMETQTVARVRWTRNNEWRNAELEAELPAGTTVPDWKGNNKVSLRVALEPTGAGEPDYIDKFTGYLLEPEPAIDDKVPQLRRVTLRAIDGVGMRLSKHFMVSAIPPGGMTLEDWFTLVLNNAGVPESLIEVDEEVADLTIADPVPRSMPRLQFGKDQTVVNALDEVINNTTGLQWGVRGDGTYFVRKRPEYDGTPDWVLDEGTVTDTDVVFAFESTRSSEDFRNYVYVAAKDDYGQLKSVIVRNSASHTDETDDRFIGEDWWKVVLAPDERNPEMRAQLELDESLKPSHNIVWKTCIKDLSPGQFVRVDVDNFNIPAGTVFEIVEESGEIAGNDGWQEFIGRVVRYP